MTKHENNITLYFLFLKTPEDENTRKELLRAVRDQFSFLPMPLKLYKLSNTSISYFSRNKFMAFSIRKPIRLTYWIKGANNEVEKFNDLVNSTSVIINAIMARFSESIELNSEIELAFRDQPYLDIKKFISNQLLSCINKETGINLNTNALSFNFEYGEHNNNIVAVNEGKILILRLMKKLKTDLPPNILKCEKEHATQIVDFLAKVDKIEVIS